MQEDEHGEEGRQGDERAPEAAGAHARHGPRHGERSEGDVEQEVEEELGPVPPALADLGEGIGEEGVQDPNLEGVLGGNQGSSLILRDHYLDSFETHFKLVIHILYPGHF